MSMGDGRWLSFPMVIKVKMSVSPIKKNIDLGFIKKICLQIAPIGSTSCARFSPVRRFKRLGRLSLRRGMGQRMSGMYVFMGLINILFSKSFHR